MNRIELPLWRLGAVLGPLYMLLAGIVFAALNVLLQWLTVAQAVPPAAAAFWQYGLALVFSLPLLAKLGLAALRTRHPLRHLARVVTAALGVQCWVIGLASVPIWQAIALVMTSPFFIVLGARIFLDEPVGAARWGATATGFAGAMIILQPWSDAFSAAALLPVVSALLWGASSLLTKSLTAIEPAETITVWLLALLTPVNAGLALAAGSLALPPDTAFVGLLAAGLLTACGQYLLTRAYQAADAAYVQPFDDLKLPLNVTAGWLAFGYAPSGLLWLGAALILAASLFLISVETRRRRRAAL